MALGDERSRSQIVTDIFSAQLTGQVTAQAVPVSLDLVVNAETLLGDGAEPGEVAGYDPIPASMARKAGPASSVPRSEPRWAETVQVCGDWSPERPLGGPVDTGRRCLEPGLEAGQRGRAHCELDHAYGRVALDDHVPGVEDDRLDALGIST